MADLKRRYKTNEALEQEGAWQNLGDGIEVKVARAGNPRHQAAIDRLYRPHRTALKTNTLSRDLQNQIAIEAMAEGLLLDWRGIELDGQPLPYSRENAIRVLTEYKDFREDISTLSLDVARFREEEIEDAAKN